MDRIDIVHLLETGEVRTIYIAPEELAVENLALELWDKGFRFDDGVEAAARRLLDTPAKV